jgi:hypothetical protein
MDWFSIYPTLYAQSKKIDTSFMSIGNTSSSSGNSTYFLVGFILFFIVLIIIYKWIQGRRLNKSGKQYLKKKAKTEVAQQQMDISENASKLIISLSNAANTVPESLITDNEQFEKAVNKVFRIAPTDPILSQVSGLREDLGYIFYNRRIPFITTKMLVTGQKLRVGVNYQGKSHSYVSTILNSSEADFWVKPPTVKGKAVNLSKFKKLEFRIFRKSDGEFRFICKLKSQINSPVNAIVMEHTDKIKKLPKREDDRYRVQFKRKFYFITSVDGLKSIGDEPSNISCIGLVDDMSIGGMKFIVDELPESAVVGTTVVFKLKEANIKQEIQGNIIRLNQSSDEKTDVHVQFYDMSELNRLYLQKFIATKNAKEID